MWSVLWELFVAGESIVTWALAALAGIVSAKVIQSIAHAKARAILDRLWVECVAATQECWQVYVSAIKKGKLNGNLTDQEKAEARAQALATIKSNLGPKGLAKLARIVGLGSVDKLITTRLEAAIAESKVVGTAAGMRVTGTGNPPPKAPLPTEEVTKPGIGGTTYRENPTRPLR